MKPLKEFAGAGIRVVLTDIDGTITERGRLPAESYSALAELGRSGLHVIPVTGRPAGWCELIARLWPVHGVIGENGALYFRHHRGKMRRWFARSKDQRREDRSRLKEILREVLTSVPGSAIASDQFSRLFDLAIDFAEDVTPPLSRPEVAKIVSIFEGRGATAKVSDIHVNGWFGDHDKVSTCKAYLVDQFGFTPAQMLDHCAFIGDSPNDEPMFGFFRHTFAVRNIEKFASSLAKKPAYVASGPEARGFVQIARKIIGSSARKGPRKDC